MRLKPLTIATRGSSVRFECSWTHRSTLRRERTGSVMMLRAISNLSGEEPFHQIPPHSMTARIRRSGGVSIAPCYFNRRPWAQ